MAGLEAVQPTDQHDEGYEEVDEGPTFIVGGSAVDTSGCDSFCQREVFPGVADERGAIEEEWEKRN